MIRIKKDKKQMVIIGAGGTGGWLAQSLSKLDGVGDTIIVDGDIVEVKNLKRQNFTEEDVNRSKSASIGERYGFGYVDDFIKDTSELEELFDSGVIPVIVGCVDNNASRKICHDVFHNPKYKDIIYVDSGNAERHGQVFVAVKQDGKVISGTPIDLDPVFQNYDGDERRPDQISCAEHSESAPQNIAANLTAANMTFNILNIILPGGILNGNLYSFDTRTMSFATETKEMA